jgi:hypothetical protein
VELEIKLRTDKAALVVAVCLTAIALAGIVAFAITARSADKHCMGFAAAILPFKAYSDAPVEIGMLYVELRCATSRARPESLQSRRRLARAAHDIQACRTARKDVLRHAHRSRWREFGSHGDPVDR